MAVIDDDLVKAELALTELRRARTLPFERSLAIIRHLASTTRNNGSRTQSIETAQADARLAISSLRFQSAIAKSESVASFRPYLCSGTIFLVRAACHDLQRMIRQRPLQRLRHPTVRASGRHREDAPGFMPPGAGRQCRRVGFLGG
jgi:hypothetical protein